MKNTTMTKKRIRGRTFDQLDERAKDRARDKLGPDTDWCDSVVEDFVRVAAAFGFEVETQGRGHPPVQWESYPWLAGFNARFVLDDALGCEKKVADEFGDPRLIHLAADFAKVLAEFALSGLLHAIYDAMCSVRYDTRGGWTFDNLDWSWRTDERPEGLQEDEQDRTIDKAIENLARDLGRWLAHQLEEEYDYQRSDAYLRDLCEGNEYRFDEDGELL